MLVVRQSAVAQYQRQFMTKGQKEVKEIEATIGDDHLADINIRLSSSQLYDWTYDYAIQGRLCGQHQCS